MQNIRMKVPKEIKTKLDEMNLLDRFLFNETVEDVEVYNDIVEICEEVPELKLNDGARRIFINTNGTNPEKFSKEFLEFMTYINSSTDIVAENTGRKSRRCF